MSTQQPEALAELRERLRSFEANHTPDGWPAVRMRDITALLDDLDNARSDNRVLRLGYAAARLEVESLKAQLHAAKQINAAHADSVQEDAARYRFLRDGEWRDTDLEPFIRLQLNTLWDAKIDAARKQGEKQ